MIFQTDPLPAPKPAKRKLLKIVDLFCGAGGTTTGAVEAIRGLGYDVEVTVVNHDPASIATHTLNHPTAVHLCSGVDDVSPRSLFKRGELDILLASPECTNHSKAKGGKPRDDQSRASGHCILKWAEQVQPNIIIVENVIEFLDWGPLGTDGKPLKSKKGATFKAWAEMLRSLGYRVEWKKPVAADYGDPTTRQRLIIMAVRGRKKPVWPERTHAPQKFILRTKDELFPSNLRPWVPAYDIIDWTIEGRWIHEMKPKAQHGGLPMSPNTLERIQIGLWKEIELMGGKVIEPFIVSWDHQSGTGNRRCGEPLTSVTTKQRHGVIQPYLIELRGTDESQLKASVKSVGDTIGTVTAGGRHHGVIESYLVATAHGNGKDPNGNKRRTKRLSETFPVVCGNRGDFGIVDIALQPMLLGQQSGAAARPVSEPSPTVACAGVIRLIQPYLVKYNGTATSASLSDPMHAVTTKDRFALVEPEAREIPKGRGRKLKNEGTPSLGMPLVEIAGRFFEVWLRWRMLQPRELAMAQGFLPDYQFAGNKTVTVKQIGNAVPRRMARAHVAAAFSQNSDVSAFVDAEEDRMKAALPS